MKKLIFMTCSLLLFQCSVISSKKAKIIIPEKSSIAVLPFTARGQGISKKTGYIAADQLTTYLFMKKKFSVIDRSQINQVMDDFKIENIYFLSRENLQAIADTLHASVVVLGILENDTKAYALKKTKNRLSVTLRFLDGKTGEILHIVQKAKKAKKTPQQMLNPLLESTLSFL